MPKISFRFEGYIVGANVEEADDVAGNTIDVSKIPAEELAKKLKSGDLMIVLGNVLYKESRKSNLEMFDFEPYDAHNSNPR